MTAPINTTADVDRIKSSKNMANTINEIISERALVGWTTGNHTGVDVPLYAFDPHADLFNGLKQNTEIPVLMAEAMKISFNN